MKRRSIKFAIVKEMQIKTTLMYHHTCKSCYYIKKKTTRAREDMEERKFPNILQISTAFIEVS